jgi:hypothetical protein
MQLFSTGRGPWLVFDEERLRAYAQQDLAGFLEWDRALLGVLLGA